MKPRQFLFIAAIGLLIMLLTTAVEAKIKRAARAPSSAAHRKLSAQFKKLDKNHDGFLIGKEVPQGFMKYDRNKDGRLSRAEFERRKNGPVYRRGNRNRRR